MILNTSIGLSSNKASEISALWIWTKGNIKGNVNDDEDDETSLSSSSSSSEWEFSHLKLQQEDGYHDSLSLSTLGCERPRIGVVEDRSISMMMSSANLSSGTVTFNESFVEATMESAATEAIQRAYQSFYNRAAARRSQSLLVRKNSITASGADTRLYHDGRLCQHHDQHQLHHHLLLLLRLLHLFKHLQ